ncbi:methyl-accepting chemotaxis protein [Aneurinibacillus uraniidurans]|uniref:methyl-accepting chemotaxis protein n=1 Tax=Aneurinibacillus uraniidurans TaxID=2966586 RepID=UPI00234919F8|nr:methyl-accepting chemotaxis protein [Aneurinibacillus sp. B1]WCN38187.1 methyl-accepting chemotaxis protein [Aneurinibacillus sp. B1]
MRWTIGKKIITGLLLSTFILASLLSWNAYTTTKSNLIESAQKKLTGDLVLGYEYINQKVPGEWRADNGKLYKGSVLMNNNNELVDQISTFTNGNTVTLFLGDTRVATNVKKEDGSRAVGTKIAPEVGNIVLKKGERYTGRAQVVGNWNQTAYEPIKDAQGAVIGIWYVGVPEAPYVDLAFTSALQNIGIAILLSVIVVTLGIFSLRRSIIRPLSTLTETAHHIANYELQAFEMKRKADDEITDLAHSFQKMITNLQATVQNLSESGRLASTSSHDLESAAHQTSTASTHIAATISDVSAQALEQAEQSTILLHNMERAIKEARTGIQHVEHTMDNASTSSQVACEGDKAIRESIEHLHKVTKMVSFATDSIHRLGQRSNEIGSIITVITDIASQTNLLALNAAIEAARAGEQGKGFAVVADEVRKLAEASNEAAQKIVHMITHIQEETSYTVRTMEENLLEIEEQEQMIEKAGTALEMIVTQTAETKASVEQVKEIFHILARDSEQGLVLLQQINRLIKLSAASAEQVAAAAQEQAATVEEVAASSSDLSKLAEQLNQEASKFKITSI